VATSLTDGSTKLAGNRVDPTAPHNGLGIAVVEFDGDGSWGLSLGDAGASRTLERSRGDVPDVSLDGIERKIAENGEVSFTSTKRFNAALFVRADPSGHLDMDVRRAGFVRQCSLGRAVDGPD